MKPIASPKIEGRTPAERMDSALRQILSVSKDDLLKKEAQEKRKKEREKKRLVEQK